MEPQNLPLWLIRNNLDEIPSAELTPGLCVSPVNGREDSQMWLELVRFAETLSEIKNEKFVEAYGTDTQTISDRVYFVRDKNAKPIATVGAWFGTDEWEGWGRIHWLYILPEYQGQGIGKALLTFALNRLKDLGNNRVYLKTSSGRKAALHLYKRYGFIDSSYGSLGTKPISIETQD